VRAQDHSQASAAPAPAEFVLGAASRALARQAPELADALRQLAARHDLDARDASRFRGMVERVPAIVYIADAGLSGVWHYVSPQVEAVLGYSPEEWMAHPDFWAERIHPDDRQEVLAGESQAVEGSPSVAAAEYRMLARDGRVVWIRDDALLVEVADGQVHWHGVMSDITDRKRAEDEAERRAAQQAAVARLGERALEGADLADLMNEATAAAAGILGTDMAGVLELRPGGDELVIRAGYGIPEDVLGKATVPAHDGSQSGATLQSRAPLVVEDWDTETRFAKSEFLRKTGGRSGLTVVIEGAGEPFGVLGVQSRSKRAYSPGDVDFVQALANALADAIHRRSTEDEIRHQALHDPLTGLPNRVLFADRLGHALARLRRSDGAVGILFLDLDHFKLVNDSLGHHAGDDLLVAVAPRLRQIVRPTDSVARFGGDEFGILLEDIESERDAAEVAERVAAAFARPFVIGGAQHFVTASVGIAIADAATGAPEELIRDADAAMYRAKERGRARYELFDEVMRARAVGRLRVENELRRALERGELRLHYQPVVSLRDGAVTGFEALLRWEHPERGLVGPLEFIWVAEEVGLIDQIGRWVLEEACRQAAQWQALRPDGPPVGISVNLSARQVAQRDLPEFVAGVLEERGLEPACLSLEITESVLLEESDAPADVLRALRSTGARLVLDDFGTGYSSLGYLKRLQLDALKVDRSFVDGLGPGEEESAIVQAIVGMAQALKLGVVAEGVETHEQLAELRRLGCDGAQGYFFARPMPPDDVVSLITEAPPWAERLSAPS
jgi:diguanylate cyclase (GGDEF)-like protein/PAS domain S-box-containing protein